MHTHCPTPGLNIKETAERLRNLASIERSGMCALAGWFLRIGAYESKYQLADSLYRASEHISWLRSRLGEMRAGNPDANVRPALKTFAEEIPNAPSDEDFLHGYYGVLQAGLLHTARQDLAKMDPVANANETRLYQRMIHDWEADQEWYKQLAVGDADTDWSTYLCARLAGIGSIHGEETEEQAPPPPSPGVAFSRPETINFDSRISRSELASYDERQKMTPQEATIEQFRVFFNEFYAAALLASILYDAHGGDYPWELFSDFSRHFWDEARHSQFGAVRLRELGVEPDRVNPILFEQSQGLPILHRIAYLTRGLEAYFMPRKPKRFKEYEQNGDTRSQLFADQDWSDEINHVRYGSRWTDHLLKDDFREVDDIIDEVREHLSEVRGEPLAEINAPF